MIYSSVFGLVFVSIFYKIFSHKNLDLFSSDEQLFDYIKFMLIAAIAMSYIEFLLFFLAIMLIFSFVIISNIANSKKKYSYGYIFISIFLYFLFNPFII